VRSITIARDAARRLNLQLVERPVTSVEDLRSGLRALRAGEMDASSAHSDRSLALLGSAAEAGVSRTRSSVDVAAMADLEDGNNEVRILHFVQDAVVPLSDPEQIPAGELLAARGSWLSGQPLHPGHDALPILR
jgi:hypothetical protein